MRPEDTSLYNGVWVDGDGPLTAEVVFVGQAPGAAEEAAGVPFVGPAGRLLQRAAAEAGWNWESVRRTNCVRCRPPKNRAPTPQELKEYWPWLEAELASMPHLRMVVALGNEALHVFSGRYGVMKRRGEEFEWRGITVMPTLHPAYILRNPRAYNLLVADLRRASSLLRSAPREPVGRIEAVPARPSGGVVAIDVETWQNGRPRLVCYGSSPDVVYAVSPDDVPYDLPNVTWLGHNVRSDERWLGMRFVSSLREDTMLMAHLLDENRPVGLKQLAQTVLGTSRYWREVEPMIARRRDEIPDHVLVRYCGNDVAATLRLYEVLSEELRRSPRLENLYRHLSIPLSATLMRASEHGVLVDLDYMSSVREELAEEARLARQDVEREVPGINIQSHEQLSRLLYERLGLTPREYTEAKGMGATHERALRALDHPLANRVLDYRRSSKRVQMLDTWRQCVGEDGRVHPDYLLVGTVTGRVSSRSPNVQNLPSDPKIRGIVRAPDGHVLVWADYAMIELAVAAWLYGETAVLDAYSAGQDLHSLTAEAVLGRPPADKEERKKFGKTPNFGLLYMQSPTGFREYALKQGISLSEEEAQRIHRRWHEVYPSIRRGWDRYRRELERDGYVEAPSGRRRRLAEATPESVRQAVNFPVQATAAELTHVSAVLLEQAMPWARLVLHVHDSIVFELPREYGQKAMSTIEGVMRFDAPQYCRRRLGFSLPFAPRVEVSSGGRWAV